MWYKVVTLNRAKITKPMKHVPKNEVYNGQKVNKNLSDRRVGRRTAGGYTHFLVY